MIALRRLINPSVTNATIAPTYLPPQYATNPKFALLEQFLAKAFKEIPNLEPRRDSTYRGQWTAMDTSTWNPNPDERQQQEREFNSAAEETALEMAINYNKTITMVRVYFGEHLEVALFNPDQPGHADQPFSETTAQAPWYNVYYGGACALDWKDIPFHEPSSMYMVGDPLGWAMTFQNSLENLGDLESRMYNNEPLPVWKKQRLELPEHHMGNPNLRGLKRFLEHNGLYRVTKRSSSSWNPNEPELGSRVSDLRDNDAFQLATQHGVPVTLERFWFGDVEVTLLTRHHEAEIVQYNLYHHSSRVKTDACLIDWYNVNIEGRPGVREADPLEDLVVAGKTAQALRFMRARDELPVFTQELDANPALVYLKRLVTSFGCQRFERWRHVNAEQVYVEEIRDGVYVEEIRDGARSIKMISDSPTIDVFTFGALRVTIHDALCERPDYYLELHVPSSSGEYEYVNVLEIPESVDSLMTLSNPLKNADVFNATSERIRSFNRRGLYFTT